MGQAFELRFKQYLHSPPRVVVPPERYWPDPLAPFPSTPAGPAPPLPWGWILAPSLLCAPHLHGPLLNHEDPRITSSPVLAEVRTQGADRQAVTIMLSFLVCMGAAGTSAKGQTACLPLPW